MSMMASNVSINRGSDETSFIDCDVCKYKKITSEAVTYCTSCGEYLCKPCTNAHEGSKLTRNHKLQKTENNLPSAPTKAKPISPIMFCEDHTTMVVKSYCKTHDDVICNKCELTSHRHCDTTDINRQAKQIKTSGLFKETLTRLEELKSKYDKMKVSRKKDKNRVKSVLDTCLQDMHQIRKDVNKALDHIEDNLSKEISQVNEIGTKDIENHDAILNDALARLSDHIKSLKECENARDDDAMYVGMKKSSSITRRYEDIISKMKDDLDQTELTFQINEELFCIIKHLQAVDKVLIDNRRVFQQTTELKDGQGSCSGSPYSPQTQQSLINLSLSDKRDFDVGSSEVFGCTFMPDGHLVLCCGAKGLILLDNDFTAKSRLLVRAYSVAVIDHNEIVITCGNQKQMQVVKLFPSMKVTKTIRKDKDFYGVAVFGEEIYVTCYAGFFNSGEVRVLNMNCEGKRRLGMDNGKSMFTRPRDVTVNKNGSKVFVSDGYSNIVTCLDKQGHVIYLYSDTDLRCPAGMYVDHEDNLFVCGYNSHHVHVIGQDGRKQKIILSKTESIDSPRCIAFRESDGCLVVGSCSTRSLISFNAK